MTQPITPARLALCAAVRLYLDSEENEVANEDTARLGPLLLRVLQFEDATGDGSGSGLDRDATLVDVLALLQVNCSSAILRSIDRISVRLHRAEHVSIVAPATQLQCSCQTTAAAHISDHKLGVLWR